MGKPLTRRLRARLELLVKAEEGHALAPSFPEGDRRSKAVLASATFTCRVHQRY